MLRIEIPQDGKNITLQVTGFLLKGDLEPTPIYISPGGGIRLDSAVWLIQEKMGIFLWRDKDDLLLPLESRGSARFDSGITLKKNVGWGGQLLISTFGFNSGITMKVKGFHLTLDMDRLE